MIQVQDSGQIPHVHEFGGEPLVNDVLFDQPEFLVDRFAHCDSYGCPECGRYFAVREKLRNPFVEVKYQQIAIAEQTHRSGAGEQAEVSAEIARGSAIPMDLLLVPVETETRTAVRASLRPRTTLPGQYQRRFPGCIRLSSGKSSAAFCRSGSLWLFPMSCITSSVGIISRLDMWISSR